MPDNLTPADRQKAMRAVKSKGTSLERRLWAMLAGMGLSGWKRGDDSLEGKPDVVFPEQHLAIFVDGCFWHGCPHCQRKLPETNHDYWAGKIAANIKRDKENAALLAEHGWRVVRIWEHELGAKADKRQVRARLRQAINSGRTAS